uniref:C2 NT-type domain-containing protein n=1 Tax=Tanacetum cinerariifolium TaxID=118510 RepID=A0A699IB56_TANCI|nr:hypothetical protein [Tanacetum cinerariifolium]
MVTSMKKWSPWTHAQVPVTGTKKLKVKVERIKIEGFEHGGGGGEKVMGVEVKWKGERKHGFGFHKRKRWCKEIVVKEGDVIVWEDDDDLVNECLFSISDSNGYEYSYLPWFVTFKFSYGDHNKGKMIEIGKVSLNLAVLASNKESTMIEKKLPIDLEVSRLTTQATISVLVSFLEIGDSGDLVPVSTQLDGHEVVKAKKKQLSLEEIILSGSDNSVTFDSDSTSESQASTQSDVYKKSGFFDWKRRRLNLKPTKTKLEDSRPTTLYSNSSFEYPNLTHVSFLNTWQSREFLSRDGESKLNTQSFFATFDQRSEKAAGPSACTALVTVIAHWLGSDKSNTMPTVQQFDTLIIDGSSEWRHLCENVSHVTQFPDKHFDLETVLRAGIRPVSVIREKSFVGFFSPEKFDSLTGVMSFDDIWNHEISKNIGVYIVSWNDHFFVLKVDEDAYYVMDTLGERLVEGCEQAYILRFDNGSYLTTRGTEEVLSNGKECCKEFIKRFLASIPLTELEFEEQREAVPYYSLHHRLQIEFNFCRTI